MRWNDGDCGKIEAEDRERSWFLQESSLMYRIASTARSYKRRIGWKKKDRERSSLLQKSSLIYRIASTARSYRRAVGLQWRQSLNNLHRLQTNGNNTRNQIYNIPRLRFTVWVVHNPAPFVRFNTILIHHPL